MGFKDWDVIADRYTKTRAFVRNVSDADWSPESAGERPFFRGLVIRKAEGFESDKNEAKPLVHKIDSWIK